MCVCVCVYACGGGGGEEGEVKTEKMKGISEEQGQEGKKVGEGGGGGI